MGLAIAHTLVSFDFDDGEGGTEPLAFLIEIRRERGEQLSVLAGFFTCFELTLVAASERYLLRARFKIKPIAVQHENLLHRIWHRASTKELKLAVNEL